MDNITFKNVMLCELNLEAWSPPWCIPNTPPLHGWHYSPAQELPSPPRMHTTNHGQSMRTLRGVWGHRTESSTFPWGCLASNGSQHSREDAKAKARSGTWGEGGGKGGGIGAEGKIKLGNGKEVGEEKIRIRAAREGERESSRWAQAFWDLGWEEEARWANSSPFLRLPELTHCLLSWPYHGPCLPQLGLTPRDRGHSKAFRCFSLIVKYWAEYTFL